MTLLAILKAGAAYVPLDPDYPADRVSYILSDCKVKALVTTRELGGKLAVTECPILTIEKIVGELAGMKESEISRSETLLTPDDTAYVIYTSGSTGRPKGVPISHRAACNLVRAEGRIFQVGAEDRVYQGFSIAFDASIEEVWLAFFAGATLVAGTTEMVRAGPALAGMLREARVTVLSCVPTLLAMFQEDVPALRLLILGGEVCPAGFGAAMGGGRAADREHLWSDGSDGHCHVRGLRAGSTRYDRPGGGELPGVHCERASGNWRRGEAGELCISGVGLSRGYLNRPELTAEKFLANPFAAPGETAYSRMYRTGDLARFNGTGEIEFLGRIDSQVKLRGFRIELAEIEAAIRECSADAGNRVGDVAVALREDVPGLQQLVAYVVEREEICWEEKLVLGGLRKRLPAYMVPACV